MKQRIISWLIHHANRLGKNQYFYNIKNKILSKYANHICYDTQFIEGKKCYSCSGAGIHHYYDCKGEIYDTAFCWYCHNGWYKRPVWNILEKVQFGKYVFHQPYKRIYDKPENNIQIINGYIEHEPSKYSKIALIILFILYEKGYAKRWYKETGNGWRLYWYWPKNWIPAIIHLIKYKSKAYPIKKASKINIIVKLNNQTQLEKIYHFNKQLINFE
jgi:hypothetical protein